MFIRERTNVANLYKEAFKTGGGGDAAVDTWSQSNQILFSIIKDSLLHQKLLKISVPEAGLQSDDESSEEEQSPPPKRARSKGGHSSVSGASKKSLNTCLNEVKKKKKIAKKKKHFAVSDGADSPPEGSGSISDGLGDVPSPRSTPRRNPYFNHSSPPMTPSLRAHTPPSSPRAQTPPATPRAQTPPLERSSPNRYSPRPQNSSPVRPPASPPPRSVQGDVQALAGVQVGPSFDDQLKEQKLLYWHNKVRAKQAQAKQEEAKAKLEEAKAKKEEEKVAWIRDKRRALLKRYFPEENLPPRLDRPNNSDDDDNIFGGLMN